VDIVSISNDKMHTTGHRRPSRVMQAMDFRRSNQLVQIYTFPESPVADAHAVDMARRGRPGRWPPMASAAEAERRSENVLISTADNGAG
jgi:hypothetical protein